MADTARFYADLPAIGVFAEVVDPARHALVPPDWCVALTDVRGSTAAIEAGRYKDVNALGAASIVAVRNAAPGLDLPFVFGGDGATLLFPGSVRPAVEDALRGVRALARERFDLELRVGVVPVDQLLDQGHPVRVARYRPSPHVCLAMLSGAGVPEAERRIKDPEQGPALCLDGPGTADLAGFECRWEPLSSRNGVVLSLLVQAVAPTAEERAATYRAVLAALDAALGDVDRANPAHVENLHIARAAAAFDQEARLRGGGAGLPFRWRRLVVRTMAGLARLLLATGWRISGFDGARYRQEVVENTDFRKFDDTLRMVVDVSEAQHQAIRTALEAAQVRGELAYGLHTSSAALMTCLVSSHLGDHLHFVDGADGGYAMAARPLKARLKAPR